MNILDFQLMKQNKTKISMITCYDFTSATIVANSDIDTILVGDSASMVMHGHDTTIPATISMMETHVKAVVKGAKNKFIIADMPFCSYRKGLQHTMETVECFMQAGANAIKLEGVYGNEDIIQHIVKSGVPVMGHVGLTPQSVHQLGGNKVQGHLPEQEKDIINQAKLLENLGCFAVVLECIPRALAANITGLLSIPTIGIGAGPETDGQVLVFQDLLGMTPDFKPRLLKTYLDGFNLIKDAINTYHQEVQQHIFPAEENCF